jgi:sirohydrochlorin ferrochelatase
MISSFTDEIRDPVVAAGAVGDVRLAFIEESKSSIATELRAFDEAGYDEVIVVPLFVAAESTRTNSYLQYLIGMRSDAGQVKQLEKEGYDIYYPRARISLAPALNEGGALKKNVLRRVQALQNEDDGEDMGVLLVGYGDQAYGQQMQETMENIGRYLKIKTDMDTVAYAFCGDLVDYSGEPIVEAIKEVLDLEEEVLVVPVLLGVDEMLQVNTIQAAVNAITTASRVRYEPTAVLPDPKINAWVEQQIAAAVTRVNDAGGDIIGEVKVPSEL